MIKLLSNVLKISYGSVLGTVSGCFDNKLFTCLNYVFTIICRRSDGHIDIQARINYLQEKPSVRH